MSMISKSARIVMISAVLSLISMPVMGQDVTKTLNITRQVKWGSQTVSAGKYTLRFDDKKDGTASVLKNGREVAKVEYKLVELGNAGSDDIVVFAAASDGSLTVRRIEFKGSKTALKFE
jgi:hypothetical protein